MLKVYIINKGGHDHSDAERFGELVYLSQGPINRYATTQIYREFSELLRDSDPEDYILPTGLTIMNLVAGAIFAHLHGRVNLLLYKPSDGKGEKGYYIERIVLLEELLGG